MKIRSHDYFPPEQSQKKTGMDKATYHSKSGPRARGIMIQFLKEESQKSITLNVVSLKRRQGYLICILELVTLKSVF